MSFLDWRHADISTLRFSQDLMLIDIRSTQTRVPEINVTFDMDHNGILQVSGTTERDTGNIQEVVITHDRKRLSKGQIMQKMKEAKNDKIEDKAVVASLKESDATPDILHLTQKERKFAENECRFSTIETNNF